MADPDRHFRGADVTILSFTSAGVQARFEIGVNRIGMAGNKYDARAARCLGP